MTIAKKAVAAMQGELVWVATKNKEDRRDCVCCVRRKMKKIEETLNPNFEKKTNKFGPWPISTILIIKP